MPGQVSVPDVEGLARGAAESAITSAGLRVGTVSEEFSFEVEEGAVIAQSPAAGTRVDNGSAVNITVSRGPVVAGAMPISPPPTTPVYGELPAITRESEVTVTGSAQPGTLVEINGGGAFATAMVDAAGAFSASVELHPNRINRLYITAVDDLLIRSAPATAQVIQDEQAPSLFIDFPTDGNVVFVEEIDVAGRVGDMLSGFMGVAVTVNGDLAETDPGIGTNGTFLRAAVPLAIGENTITASATDEAGNAIQTSVNVTRRALSGPRIRVLSGNGQQGVVNSRLPEPVIVEVTEEDGTPIANCDLTARVTRSDGQLSSDPDMPNPDGIRLDLQTDAQGRATMYWTLGSDAGCGNNRLEVSSTDTENRVFYCATGMADSPDQINVSAGNNQKVELNSTAPKPLRVWVSDGNNGVPGTPVTFKMPGADGYFNGEEGRQEITMETSVSGFAEVTYTLGALDGHNLITADFAGNTSSPATFDIAGLARGFETATTFSGQVLDNASCPIGGATVELSVDSDTLITTSDVNGRFTFSGTPSGFALLHVRGETATQLNGTAIPAGTFPALEFEVYIVPSTQNSLSMPVLLPAIDPANGRMYDGSTDVELTVEGLEGVKLTIAAGSMTLADGTRPSPENPVLVSVDQVHYDELPMPMPNGAAPPMTLTFQPPGAHYDPPVKVEYPNTTGLAPGQIVYFLSFNHDTGQFEIVSSGSVAEDGSTIASDPGGGIPMGGWQGQCPPYTARGKARDRCGVVAVLIFAGGTDIQDVIFAALGQDFTAGLQPLKQGVDAVDPEKVRSFIARSQSNGALQLLVGNLWLEQLKRDLPPDCPPPKVVIVGYSLGGDTLRMSGGIDAERRFAFDPIARELVFPRGCLAYQRAESFPAPPNTETILAGEFIGDDLDRCIPPMCDIGIIGGCLRGYRMTGGAISTIPAADHSTIVSLASPRVITAVEELVSQLPGKRKVRKGNGPALALNETFTLMVAGQSYQPDQSGFFLIENISVPDDFGTTGPGSPRDMVGDEFVRITGSGEIDGETWYVFSDPFQVRSNGVEVIDSLIFRQTPPVLPVSIRATPESAVVGTGATIRMEVLATLADDSRVDISSRADLTTYRTSNGRIATVDNDGMVSAFREGTVYITATNSGATSVARITVVPAGSTTTVIGAVEDSGGAPVVDAAVSLVNIAINGTTDAIGDFTLPEVPAMAGSLVVTAERIGNGPALVALGMPLMPVAGGVTNAGTLVAQSLCELYPGNCDDTDLDGVRDVLEGTLGLTVGSADSDNDGTPDGAEDLDFDGLSVLLEDALRTDSGRTDSDMDGLSDSEELRLGTSPTNPDSDGDGLLDGEDNDPTTADDMAPEVMLTAPASGTVLVEGQPVTLEAEATDDGRVTSVTFFANSTNVGLDQFSPFEVNYTVPVDGGSSLAIEAIARDTNSNMGSSGVQSFTVIPDPGSTVTGLVLDSAMQPVEGAEVTILDDFVTSTGVDGRFSLDQVPTVVETYTARARLAQESGRPLTGSSMPITPVRGGTTDVGTIIIREAPLFDGLKFPVEDSPVDVAVADVDEDGALDAVVALSSTLSRIRLFPGKGDGTFEQSVLVTEPSQNPKRIALADMDADTHLDLVVVQGATFSQGPAQVSVYPGDGAGNFGTAINSPLLAGNMTPGIVLADLDGDEVLDLVTATGTNTEDNVEVLLGNGDGSFAPGVFYAAGLQVNGIAVADLDEDAAPDIVALDFTGNQIYVLFNNADGSGTFQDGLLTIAAVSGRLFPSTAVIEDFDGDSHLDLAVGFGNLNNPAGSAMVTLGNGDGTFQEPTFYLISSLSSPTPISINADDMNGDGTLDLVMANRNTSEIAVLPGVGNGAFGEPINVAAALFPQALVTADMDNDGDTDTVTVNLSLDLMVHRNGGSADLTMPPPATAAVSGSTPVSIVAADFDGDLISDVAVSFRNSDNVGIFRGKADGTFESPAYIAVSSTPTNLSVGDFNSDTIADLVVPSQDNNLVTLLVGNGDSTFQAPVEIALGIGNLPGYATVGRFNEDTFDDIAVTVELARVVVVLLGNGDGTFQAPQQAPTGASPQFLTNGDVDQDGNVDLLVAVNDFPGGVEIHAGNGDGTFATGDLVFPITNGLYIQHMDVTDLDQDGFMDITVMTGYSDPVDSKGLGPFRGGFYLLYGRGGGNFEDALFQPGNGSDPGQGSAADVDGDGILDLVSASGGGRDVSILLGAGDRSFQPEQRYNMNRPGRTFAAFGTRFQVYDANGDGLNDIIAVFGNFSVVQSLLQIP